MAVTLTPDQQAKLDQFETDAAAAVQAKKDAEKSSADLVILTDLNARQKQGAIDALHAALASAQLFIASMLPEPAPTPAAALAAKPK